MKTGYRHADGRYPFLWEGQSQPPARWHGTGQGPCQYFADTPDGAWAEFLRHEEITDPDDLIGVARSMWAVQIPDDIIDHSHQINEPDAYGDETPYSVCQERARAARDSGATALAVPSAALLPGAARGQATDGAVLHEGPERDGIVAEVVATQPGEELP